MQKNTPKLLFFLAIFLCLIQTSFISCSQDEDLIDLVGLEDPDEETIDGSDGNNDGDPDGSDDQETPDLGETDNGPDFDSSEGLKIDNTPCDYTLDGIESNSTLEIACRMDLGGQTVTVPSGVTFVFAGGEIINGTLNFSAQGTIDGDLLNKDLTIEGDVKLDDPIFQFYPERWDLIQGENIAMQRAKDNSLGIQAAIDLVHYLGGSTFEIDRLDAFFYGKDVYNYNIVMPSNFHLRMTENTHLRTFPSVDDYSTFLIIIQGVENVRVSGGYLHGDRDLYNRRDNLPGSHTIKIKTGVNVVIDNVHMSNATQDGLAIESNRFAYDPDYVGSNNILIKDCVFDSNRRINLTITDGENITVDGCTFIDGGINTDKSVSSAPSCNLNIEPLRSRDASGNLVEYQRVKNVSIRNSKQFLRNVSEQPNAGGFLLSHGYGPIIIENNEMIDTGISFHTVDGAIISNNIISGGGINAGSAGNYDRVDFVYGNEIYGNVVVNQQGTAINVAGNGVFVHDNEFEGTVGMALGAGSTDYSKGTSNCKIENNIIRASNTGIRSINTVKNVLINANNIHMLSGSNFSLVLGNRWGETTSSANYIVKDNTVTDGNSNNGVPGILIGANSLSFTQNNVGNIQINESNNIELTNNIIDTGAGESGVVFNADAPNSIIANNDITIYPSQTPLNVQCITQANGVSLSSSVNISNNNSCTEQ